MKTKPIRYSKFGFKEGHGWVSTEGVMRAYELPFEVKNEVALIQELTKHVKYKAGCNHYSYKLIDGDQLYILANGESALEHIEGVLNELVNNIQRSRKIIELANIVE
jgi:hypothetical protein